MDYALTEKAVRGLAQLLRGNRGNTGGGGTAYGVISFVNNPPPFTVRWSSKETSSGAWVIWLPSLSSLVNVDGAAVTITGVAAAQNLAAGWYTVSGVSASSTAIYLNITIPDPDQTGATTTAELSASAASSSTGNKVYPLTVATLATDATTGAKSVKQSLSSAVVIGGDTAALDEQSIDKNTSDEVEIKGWETGTPAGANSVGDILGGNGGTGEDAEKVICRQADGSLVFRQIGNVSGGGLSGTVNFVADVKYDLSDHQLQQRIDTLNLATGQVTPGQYATITNGQAVPLP